ncbi:hypothetical protein ACFWFQ_00690 [Nocardia salmonicida]|uniref:hypothetical protein n=1 Tax=Nocardia salmonicida TaxID=53431 RepID=UPI0036557197
MVSKLRGHIVAGLWSELVASWAHDNQSPRLHSFEAYSWTEIMVGNLHVRIQRDTQHTLTRRRLRRKHQQTDGQIPLFARPNGFAEVTNVDVIASLAENGQVRGVFATAPLGAGQAWERITVDMPAAQRRLQSWTQRSVPWLETVVRIDEVSGFDAVLDRVLRAEALSGPAAGVDISLDRLLTEINPQQRRPGFRVPPRGEPQTGSEGN